MPYDRLKRRLSAGGIVILDGATGTELQRRGAPMDPAAWCGPATLHNDKLLTEIHADYIAAGAEVITANSYASSRLMLTPAGLGDRVEEINRRAVEAALRARDQSGNKDVVVAGSLSHMVPVARGTGVVDANKTPDDATIAEAFHELAQILAASGCELILLEMMYNRRRTPLVLEAALATGLPVWFGASARRAKDGRLISFDQLEETPLDAITGLIPQHGVHGQGVDAAGIMHSYSELVAEALQSVRRHFAGPLMAYPDAGYFAMPDWQFVDVIPPDEFEAFCGAWIEAGVQILGGCCGLTVAHVEAAVRARNAAA
ncbi:MAG: homocysteine S-methyltransferase family protein [Kiloniellales bacterium]